MSEIKLKPCPFCGGEAKINRMPHLWEYSVQCNNVDCIVHPETEGYEKGEEAIEAWNTRKPMERIVEQLENKMDHSFENQRYKAFAEAVTIVRKGGVE